MGVEKVVVALGVVLLILGALFMFAPASQEIWEPKSILLISATKDVSLIGSQELLAHYFLLPGNVRELKLRGYVKLVEGEPFSFEITNGEVYVGARGVSERSFEFPVQPEELRDGLWLRIYPAKAKVSVRVEASWEERTYAHVLGGVVLGGLLGLLGVVILIVALILYVVRR